MSRVCNGTDISEKEMKNKKEGTERQREREGQALEKESKRGTRAYWLFESKTLKNPSKIYCQKPKTISKLRASFKFQILAMAQLILIFLNLKNIYSFCALRKM